MSHIILLVRMSSLPVLAHYALRITPSVMLPLVLRHSIRPVLTLEPKDTHCSLLLAAGKLPALNSKSVNETPLPSSLPENWSGSTPAGRTDEGRKEERIEEEKGCMARKSRPLDAACQ